MLTSQEDGTTTLTDSELLDRATTLSRVLVTHDYDLLTEASQRQAAGEPFSGVAYAHQLGVTVGQMVRDLDLMDKVYDPPDMENQVERLPL